MLKWTLKSCYEEDCQKLFFNSITRSYKLTLSTAGLLGRGAEKEWSKLTSGSPSQQGLQLKSVQPHL